MLLLRKSFLRIKSFPSIRASPYISNTFSSLNQKSSEPRILDHPKIDSEPKFAAEFSPSYDEKSIKRRIQIFEKIYDTQQQELKAITHREIDVILKDGKVVRGHSWETTPFDIAKKISKKLAEKAVVAKVVYLKRDVGPFSTTASDVDDCMVNLDKGELIDLNRPIEGDCMLEILTFEEALGKTVFWHSSAHVLGAALEQSFGGHLCIGPSVEEGFYYDVFMGNMKLSPTAFEKIEKAANDLISGDFAFQKIYLSKSEAMDLFQDNPFKVQLIKNKIAENAVTTAYRCGSLVDLCTGPHVTSTSKVKALKCTKTSSSYWLGKVTNESLQRIYGVSFPTQKQLDEHLKLQEEILKRDHRNIGLHQNLFFFSNFSPGSAFFYPHGTMIYNRLQEFIRNEYRVRGYQEVITPNIYNSHLWETSGHWAKYRENMFLFNVEDQEFGLKPMNCPGHCVMFSSILRSYRELPIRYADFSALHRNEITGALSGLTRVRKFCQDDAHIFCTVDQIQDEIMGCLDFLKYIYDCLGFEFSVELSTRPENALGNDELWEKAEGGLVEALKKFGRPWKINPGDGAFYGPKIDIKTQDALKREHQLGTIQLDFVLPERFNLQYKGHEDFKAKEQEEVPEHEHTSHCSHPHHHHLIPPSGLQSHEGHDSKHHHLKTGFQRPVMIHRAILGSLERMIAILCEHTGGKWPFWLSPRQVKVIPISEKSFDYAESIYNRLVMEGYSVEVDRSNLTIGKKVRNAQLEQFNYLAVVGEEEMKSNSIDLRERGQAERLGKFTIKSLLSHFDNLKPKPSDAKRKLTEKSFFSEEFLKEKEQIAKQEEFLIKLNSSLQLQMFLEDDLHPKEQDFKTYEAIRFIDLNKEKFPNIYRWKHAIEKFRQESKN